MTCPSSPLPAPTTTPQGRHRGTTLRWLRSRPGTLNVGGQTVLAWRSKSDKQLQRIQKPPNRHIGPLLPRVAPIRRATLNTPHPGASGSIPTHRLTSVPFPHTRNHAGRPRLQPRGFVPPRRRGSVPQGGAREGDVAAAGTSECVGVPASLLARASPTRTDAHSSPRVRLPRPFVPPPLQLPPWRPARPCAVSAPSACWGFGGSLWVLCFRGACASSCLVGPPSLSLSWLPARPRRSPLLPTLLLLLPRSGVQGPGLVLGGVQGRCLRRGPARLHRRLPGVRPGEPHARTRSLPWAGGSGTGLLARASREEELGWISRGVAQIQPSALGLPRRDGRARGAMAPGMACRGGASASLPAHQHRGGGRARQGPGWPGAQLCAQGHEAAVA